jgi:phospholipid/cholesterol/gamma-HCH transport system substrate-binding protein
MRKLLTIAIVAAVVVAVVLLAGGSGGDGYKVRAVFDNGGFMVKGEQVRVAGANVGTIDSVTVSEPGEITSYRHGKPEAIPGKAILVMDISDPGFQDFRSDASCLIRPQSLIGEKFVDCRPTLPRAPGTEPPPALREIPSGQPGAGQHLLPLENNSTSVDPDLINDIQTLPYAQGFRLIFNELGGGLAARGEDLKEIIERANPTLRDADRLFAILNAQRDQLNQLTADSDAILEPLARERAHFAGFFVNSGAAAEASAERGEALEASLRKFPRFLQEFRVTMRSLQNFSDAAAPVFADFNKASPAYTEATRALTPFSAASAVALKSLGATGEAAGPTLREADPVIKKSRDLAISGVSPTTNLAKLFVSTEQSRGWRGLADLIYNTTATLNGFDQYGHFARSLVTLTNCLDYEIHPKSGCAAKFTGPGAVSSAVTSATALYRYIQEELTQTGGGVTASSAKGRPAPAPEAAPATQSGGTGPLLDYLLGP